MSIKIAFFDIDWTLYDHAAQRYIPSAIEAIRRLKANGVKVFLCSARPYHSQKHFGAFDLGIAWDGYIASCGAIAAVGKKTIRKLLVDKRRIRHLVKTVTSLGLTMEIVTPKSRFMVAPPNEHVASYHNVYREIVPPVHPYYNEECTGALLFAPEEYDEQLKKANPGLTFFRFHDFGVDIVQDPHEKGEAIADILAYYGYKKEEAISFGDDYQDLSMKISTGIFVAVGNGRVEVKAQADYVTAPIAEDGIAKALVHFGLIEENIL